MYFVKTPRYLKSIFKDLVWEIPSLKNLYLTFDDGPIPSVTNEILKMLDDHNAQATFFCIGNNVKKNFAVFEKIIAKGHAIGNHTMTHVNGWRTSAELYLNEVEQCDTFVNSKLFRPPYGRISFSQLQQLKNKYKIIMWDVLSGDFDTTTDAHQCIQNVTANAAGGSIIVFHDSEKAKDRVLQSLPVILKYFSEKNFKFEKINFETK